MFRDLLFLRDRKSSTPSKWVLKRIADNSYKARVVAQGGNQVPGLDCGNTFAPVCRLQNIRMVLAIAAELDLEVDQLGVKTAFLYADLEEEVFVAQTPGYETKDKDGGPLVMRLEKSLYGLAQSPGNWFHTIDPVLKVICFIPSSIITDLICFYDFIFLSSNFTLRVLRNVST